MLDGARNRKLCKAVIGNFILVDTNRECLFEREKQCNAEIFLLSVRLVDHEDKKRRHFNKKAAL